MALDKLVDSTQLDAGLGSVADAIRAKGSTSAQLSFPAGFVSAIGAISTGGGNVQVEELTPTSSMSSVTLSVSFEPAYVLIMDNYGYDNYDANSGFNFGGNGDLPVLVASPEWYFYIALYSAANGSPQFRRQSDSALWSYNSGQITISLGSNTNYKDLQAGHRYTIVIVGVTA